jgi:hypothetical protein
MSRLLTPSVHAGAAQELLPFTGDYFLIAFQVRSEVRVVGFQIGDIVVITISSSLSSSQIYTSSSCLLRTSETLSILFYLKIKRVLCTEERRITD